MSVHYKFKSNLNYDTVTFDGLHISVADLKKSIMQQKKIGKSSDFDLQITNAQTKEVYDNEETLVPKNTSVIVARVPVASGNKKNWEKPELPLPIDIDEPSGQIRFDKLVKNADLANANVTEDDKVKAMISQSSQEYDPSKYVKSRSMAGPLPPSYTCYRCGKQGHWIKNCPTNNPDVKRSTGIPRSFMVPVDGPEHKGALLTSSGEYAVPIIDHQAYKEIKKEKPPFVSEPDQAPEPDAEIPDELLCMFCKNLLQDAVLIPCCGNSFCDECVRQALLDSDNHECPLCHETDISPDTVIPNRFLRTAVLNFKNETGYTRVKKLFQPLPVETAHIESPQPSPDSTVETQPPPIETSENNLANSEAAKDIPEQDLDNKAVKEETQENTEETPELVQPGTPLADEPEDDMSQTLPIEIIGRGHLDDYHSVPYSSQGPPDTYDQDSRDTSSSDHGHINTIETITNFRKTKFSNRLPPLPSRQHYISQGPRHHHERSVDYDQRDRSDYHTRYDRRSVNDKNPTRAGVRPHSRYERSPHDSRYHHSDHRDYRDYVPDHDQTRDFDVHSTAEQPRRRPRYASPPLSAVHPSYPVEVAPPYVPPVSVAPSAHQPAPPPPPPLLPPPQATFPPQPPPPGASPIDNSSHIPPQPPPPGVGPLLPTPPPALADSTSSNFGAQPFKAEESKVKVEERSIDDRIEAFQRELEKRERDSARDHSSRSSSRSRNRNRSRSSSRSSHSRSYTSSKSWTRSASRSLSRSRSRSRSTYSSRRTRSRSFSRSRSRSRSKTRSFTRSPSRSRSKSRSRSRERRRTDSRERLPTPFSRNHSTSHSPSPRNFHPRGRRSPYPIRRNYNPTAYNTTFAAPYTTAPSVLPLPAPYPPPPHHMHSVHAIQPPPVSHPIDHYPPERRYQYNDQYTSYDVYQHQPKPYGHQRYEREQRNPRFESHDYQRRVEEVHHRIPGWVGDRSRQEYKPRYRMQRDQQRKEIKELPKLPELDIAPVRIQKTDIRAKENKEEMNVKKKEEKQFIKHKKHHHHRTKETKKIEKQDSKVPVEMIMEKPVETSNLIKVEVLPEEELATKKVNNDQKVKTTDKIKEKKHKHKKHKTSESGTKKKKLPKKEKSESGSNDAVTKVKTKKKKNKMKVSEEVKKKDKTTSKHPKRDIEPEKECNKDDSSVINYVDELKVETHPESIEASLSETKLEHMDHVTQETENELGEEQALSDAEPAVTSAQTECDDAPVTVGGTSDVPDVTSPNGVLEEEEEEEGEEEEEEIGEEEEVEENPVEDELHVEVPGLSKWEREEYEEDTVLRPQRKSAVVVPKEERGLLSSDIIQRAEKVILHKPLKTAIVVTSNKEKLPHKAEKISVKSENVDNVPLSRAAKYKDQIEPKTLSPSEKPDSPILQVTISTDKEKRSVQTKEGNRKDTSKVEVHSSKRVKLDRSNFSNLASDVKVPQSSSRTVVVEQWTGENKKQEKWKFDSEKIKLRSSESKSRDKSRERKDDSSQFVDRNRDVRHKEQSREIKERRYDSSDKRLRDATDSNRPPDRNERNKRNPSDIPARERRYGDSRDSYRSDDRQSRETHFRSRSRSYGSSESYNSLNRKYHGRRHPDSQYEKSSNRQDDHESYNHRQKSVHMSPTPKRELDKKLDVKRESTRDFSKPHTKQIYHDESKFEPDYDEFSDSEDVRADTSNDKYKRSSGSNAPESNRKRFKHEQGEKASSSAHVSENRKEKSRKEKSSSPSSVSSSSPTESDSSDAENKGGKSKGSDSDHKQRHKRTRHKKHKKHKHKHKKKKSHKSKQKD